ncbi:MAG: peptidylprolyl isomerase [Nitrospirae bacterium]|nr:peptidylprolyl isomerase [Nitrospirota bacterium]
MRAALLFILFMGLALAGIGSVGLAIAGTEPAAPQTEPAAPQAQPVVPPAEPVIQQTQPVVPPAEPVIQKTQPVVIDRIAAVVNQEVITLSEVQEAVLQQAMAVAVSRGGPLPQPGDPGAAAAALTPQALSQQMRRLIERRLQQQAAEQHGITVTEAELQQAIEDIKTRNRFASDDALARALAAEGMTMEAYRRQLRNELLVAKLVSREVRSTVVIAPEEVQQYYDQHADDFSLPERVRLRQIFLAAPADNAEEHESKRAKAQSLLEQLRNGAEFDQLARRFSNGPEAKEGGLLGWFTPGSLMPQLDRAAFGLQNGQISDLIESPVGWHILKMEEREGHRRQPFESIKDAVHGRLMEQRTRERYEEWFLELRRNAYVDIRL